MSIDFRKKTAMQNHLLDQQHVVFNAAIVHNATPANKVRTTDISGVAILRCQGQTADADAIESGIAYTTPVDSTGIFGLLLDEQVTQINKVVVTPSAGTVVVTSGISAGGRLFLNIDSSLDLTAADLSMLIELDYKLKV